MTDTAADPTDLPDHIEQTVHALAELHADHHRRAGPLQRIVDRAVRLVGRPAFVAWLTAFLGLWMLVNLVPRRFGLGFDAPPFAILQLIAALGAFYITVLILITQRHENELTDHREQLTLQLAMLSEQKNAKIVELLEEMRRDDPMMRNRIDSQADALSVPADAGKVLEAIKLRQGEMLASVNAQEIARPSQDPQPAAG